MPAPSADLTSGFLGGVIAGGGAALACMRWMIRGALNSFELQLTNKFDKRYHMLPQRQER